MNKLSSSCKVSNREEKWGRSTGEKCHPCFVAVKNYGRDAHYIPAGNFHLLKSQLLLPQRLLKQHLHRLNYKPLPSSTI